MSKRGAGEGSIYKTSDGRWRGAVTLGYKVNDNGGVTQIRKVLSGATRAEVANLMKKALPRSAAGNEHQAGPCDAGRAS